MYIFECKPIMMIKIISLAEKKNKNYCVVRKILFLQYDINHYF
jgi:hypothetical protein